MQNEINGISEIIGAAHERGLEIVFNPSPFGAEILSYPLENIDWFVVNETEAEELTGETEPEKILGAFSQKFPRASVLLTPARTARSAAQKTVLSTAKYSACLSLTRQRRGTLFSAFSSPCSTDSVQNAR